MKTSVTHWVALGLFTLFQFFSIGTLIWNIIEKKHNNLNFVPAFFFFCVFLYFAVLNDYLTINNAIIYFILLIVCNIGLNTLNYHLSQSEKINDSPEKN